jgi:hypothetical protein
MTPPFPRDWGPEELQRHGHCVVADTAEYRRHRRPIP